MRQPKMAAVSPKALPRQDTPEPRPNPGGLTAPPVHVVVWSLDALRERPATVVNIDAWPEDPRHHREYQLSQNADCGQPYDITVSAFRRAVEALPSKGPDAVGPAIAGGAQEASPEDLARLTEILAESGASIGKPTAERIDVASTGGPGSLTTLLAPLAAVACGARVSKIAVPGRPAGGIDTLGSIPGFRTELDLRKARAALESCGYLHTMAGRNFCPLDASFFAWRQKNGAQAIPELAIASLLSKKLAAGVGRVALDIRVGPHGNFGPDRVAAIDNADRFVEVANILGINAAFSLSATSGIAQPFVGRGEALVALHQALDGSASGWLLRHVHDCFRLASLAIGRAAGHETTTLVTAAKAHDSMLSEHGVKLSEYDEHVERVRRENRIEIVADEPGYMAADVDSIRRILVNRQRTALSRAHSSFPDPCGVILNANVDEWVPIGHVLASVRDRDNPQGLATSLLPYINTVKTRSVRLIDEDLEITR